MKEDKNKSKTEKERKTYITLKLCRNVCIEHFFSLITVFEKEQQRKREQDRLSLKKQANRKNSLRTRK